MIDLRAAERITGWMSRESLAWLAARARLSTTIIECGCWEGRSTRALADHTAGVVYAVDTWASAPSAAGDHVYAKFRDHLGDHLHTGRVQVRRGPTLAVLPMLAAALGPIADFIFIDADHHYEAVRDDLTAALPLLRPGGIIAGHDYTNVAWPGVKRAVDERFGPAVILSGAIWWVGV